jgi:WD40 repeat protein
MKNYTGPYNLYKAPKGNKVEIKFEEEKIENEITPDILNGYDGSNGAHKNLIWISQEGWQLYTLHNKVIFEKTKTRDQQVCAHSTVQLSTMAISPDHRFVAAGEGSKNNDDVANILLYEIQRTELSPYFKLELKSKLNFHQKGVQALAFSNCGKFLISCGIEEEGAVAVFDVESGLVLKSFAIKEGNVASIAVDPFITSGHIQFTTVGSNGLMMLWRMDENAEQLQYFVVDVPNTVSHSHLVSCSYT